VVQRVAKGGSSNRNQNQKGGRSLEGGRGEMGGYQSTRVMGAVGSSCNKRDVKNSGVGA
jgi:hypothetical protein